MEKKRCKIVFEAGKGTILDVVEKEEGWVIKALLRKENEVNGNEAKNVISSKEAKLINTWQLAILPNVSAGEYAKVLSVYTDKAGNRAVVPPGFTVSGVAKENIIWGKNKGLVIYRIPEEEVNGINWEDPDVVETLMIKYDQYVWIPVELLTANGTLDGIHFNEKFGIRIHKNDEFSKPYYEPLVRSFLSKKESIDKYDGYYVSRYLMSRGIRGKYLTLDARTVKGSMPWTDINLGCADVSAWAGMVDRKIVTRHILHDAEYDTIAQWLIDTGTVSIEDIAEDSTNLGNYKNNNDYPDRKVKTGEDGCINNIYGLAGNVTEMTVTGTSKEFMYLLFRRGGNCLSNGYDYPIGFRGYSGGPNDNDYYNGYRTTLRIK